MNRTVLRLVSLFAIAVTGCGPGDHANGAGLSGFFGAGAAGKGADSGAAEDPDGDRDATSGGASGTRAPAAAGGANGNRPITAGGSRPTPTSADAPSAGGAAGEETPSDGAAGTPADSTTPPEREPPPSTDPETGASCMPGYVSIAGECVCDMNGSFAFHGRTAVSLRGSAPIESLNDTIDVWGIVRLTYDAAGRLELSLTSCGQTTPDICAGAQPPVLPTAEAYAQYVPVEAWDKSPTPVVVQMSFPDAVPGAVFAPPSFVQLFGIALADPLGRWPATRTDVEGSADFDGSAVNGARWVDMDADGELGLTLEIVGPGGATATATSGPPRSYGTTSAACPRTNKQAARSPYAYVPMPQGLGVKRIKRMHTAQRSTFELHGQLESCDRISGELTGANGGKATTDALFGGCVAVNGSGESACSPALLDTAESGGAGTTVGLDSGAGDFVLVRVVADATCAEVRALAFE